MSALDDVLDAIARAVGAPESGQMRVGDVTLTPAQVEAVHLVRRSLDEFGGALLADAPGSGKTFVALAVAADYGRCLVAAPASLRSTWRAAAARAAVETTFVSLEALSRGHVPPPARFVIVDEAHRVASTRARRYARVAALAHGGHLLLLTATPVRNRRAERDALLGLFLGRQAESADDVMLARCLIRREHATPASAPETIQHEPIAWRGDPQVAALLRALPPPVALADGDPASGLVATGLARSWASSMAALDQTLVRRLQRGAAIRAALDAGRLPARDDLRAWVLGDDAMQLALPIFAAPAADAVVAASRDTLERHITAVASLHRHVSPAVRRDAGRRAARLRVICDRHAGAVVIAFTCFEATARAIFSVLRTRPGVVILTGQHAASGAGPLAREDVLDAIGPTGGGARRDADGRVVVDQAHDSAAARMPIRLVIATDLLSEGVNLQGASVIVHLDDPWTPSALEQRVGRAVRMGSTHGTVHLYRLAAPRCVAALVGLRDRHAVKRCAASHALRPGDVAERLRRIISPFRRDEGSPERDRNGPRIVGAVAACGSALDGFVAVVRDDACTWSVAGVARPDGGWTISDDPWTVHRMLSAAQWTERAAPNRWELARMTGAMTRWTAVRMARGSAGLDRAPSVAARRLLSRLDRVVAVARDAARPGIAARVGRVRMLVAWARGAGIELRMASLLAHPHTAPGWLDRVEGAFEAPPGPAPVRGRIELVALLALRAASPTDSRAPGRRPSRQEASPGNVVTR